MANKKDWVKSAFPNFNNKDLWPLPDTEEELKKHKFEIHAMRERYMYTDDVRTNYQAEFENKTATETLYKAQQEQKRIDAARSKITQTTEAQLSKLITESYTSANTTWPEYHELDHRLPEEKIMANKFLPFIVEKSTPTHIYGTLLQRSKGMNMNLVTSIFYMVMGQGVSELREYVKGLPAGLTVYQMYEEMVGKYSQYQILDEDFLPFLKLSKLFSAHDWADVSDELTKDFNSKDIMAFLFVMHKIGCLDEYTTLNFTGYFNDTSEVLGNVSEYVLFADDGIEVFFTSSDELRTYIMYRARLRSDSDNEPNSPVKAVFLEEKESDTSF